MAGDDVELEEVPALLERAIAIAEAESVPEIRRVACGILLAARAVVAALIETKTEKP